jgi:hypothetical protein
VVPVVVPVEVLMEEVVTVPVVVTVEVPMEVTEMYPLLDLDDPSRWWFLFMSNMTKIFKTVMSHHERVSETTGSEKIRCRQNISEQCYCDNNNISHCD